MLNRKRPSTFNSPFVPSFAQPNKLPKPATSTTTAVALSIPPEETHAASSPLRRGPIDEMVSILADEGCTLIDAAGPPCLPFDLYNFRHRLDGILSEDSYLRSQFLEGFSAYICSTSNLRRILLPCRREGFGCIRSDSLVRILLLVKSIQQDLQEMLLEKLPEYFVTEPHIGGSLPISSSGLDEDMALLILNQFTWLDFLVDAEAFSKKLLQVLSICPHHLKKEIIGSLPEIIGDQNNHSVVSSLQHILEEDSSIIVPVLDSFSNLNLDDLLQDQVIMIALSCIRTIDVEHMPYLLKFLLLSAKASNARLIISQVREQLKFVGGSHLQTSQKRKLKGKSVVDDTEVSILDALRSSLRFKSMLCQEILKELRSIEEASAHKGIDIWLLTLAYMNGESLQRNVEKLLKKKILEGCIQEHMFDRCIYGIKEFSKDYLPTFLSLSAYLLTCKEQRAQEFGIHMYICLFEELTDGYSRQEVLGALLTHIGSGISNVVSFALNALVKLVSEKPLDLVSLSSHITGILDYLEGFSIENLDKVYEVFTLLAVAAQSSSQVYGSSIANELLMILRKQINNSDLMYKKMGLIGTLKMIANLADTKNTSLLPLSQRSNYEEAVELLKLSLDSCKQLPLPLILFYEQLVSTLQCTTLHPIVMDWVGKQVGEFEQLYLSDLDGGCLQVQDSSFSLEGELWMNLDGDISPICLKIMALLFSSLRSSPLQVLPAKFVLLALVEKMTNQGSLGGIDALLGCPLYLPSSKLFLEPSWQSLTWRQKHNAILSLYYAANWIRELLNAFSSQVEGPDAISQTSKEDIILKLSKRLRNLVTIECLLNNCLKNHPVILPEVLPHLELAPVIQHDHLGDSEKKSQHLKVTQRMSKNRKRKILKSLSPSANSNIEEKLRQPTIIDVWKKEGAMGNKEVLCDKLSLMSSATRQSEVAGDQFNGMNMPKSIEISAPATCLEVQKYKFRPLTVESLLILACFENNQGYCCADPSAELPLHLYLLRDLHKKLDHLSSVDKPISPRASNAPAGFVEMKSTDLSKIWPLFPYLRKNFDRALCILSNGAKACQDHWKTQSISAATPEVFNTLIAASPIPCSISVLKETLGCLGKFLNVPDVLKKKTLLSDILRVFQPVEMSNCLYQELNLIPSPGNVDYLYCGAYVYIGGIFNLALAFSFALASEVLFTLEIMVTSIRVCLSRSQENGKDTCTGFNREILPLLSKKLGNYAEKFLMHKFEWDNNLESKGGIVRRVLHIYLEKNEVSTSDLLNKISCSVLPQVSSTWTSEDDNQTFPTLCPATLVIWYRVMHEENLSILQCLVNEIAFLEKSRVDQKGENIRRSLNKILQSVNVVVSLINMCRANDKVSIHAMAVKYGGKYIGSFLKVFYFLQAHFLTHKETILQLIRELQKATRTIQILCSEAKGSKKTAITGRIPTTKRSLERFLFHVKALLHITPNGCSFWLGNLKHKDLMGHVVSSQAYLDESEGILEDQQISVGSPL